MPATRSTPAPSVSAASAFPEPRLRLLGTGGGLLIQTLDTQEDALREGRDPRDPTWGTETDVALLVTGVEPAREIPRERGAWPSYYRGVARSILGQGPPPVDPREVVADLRVIEAARDSAATGQAIVLDPPAGHIS